MSAPARSRRERICLGCREKLCCSYYTVAVTGPEVRRIAQAMELSPRDFLQSRQVPEPGPGRFRLEPEGPVFELILAKRWRPAPLLSPCIFLARTTDGHAVCGLGDLRPAQCQDYPVYVHDDIVALVNDPAGCVRTWSPAELDVDEERERIGRHAEDTETHHRIVEAWNARVRSGGRSRSFDEFCAFLLNRCAERTS